MVYLSTQEKDFALSVGILMKAAERGIGPTELSSVLGLNKNAQSWAALPVQLPILTSLLLGMPLGAAAHGIHNKIKKRRIDEKALQDKIEYYRNLSNELEQGLTANV